MSPSNTRKLMGASGGKILQGRDPRKFAVLRPSFWAFVAMGAVSLSYIHGLTLPASGLSAYEHPVWVRPLEVVCVLVAILVDLRATSRTTTSA